MKKTCVFTIFALYSCYSVSQCEYFNPNSIDTNVCAGEIISTDFTLSTFAPWAEYSSALFLPDGSGQNYQTSLIVSGIGDTIDANIRIKLCISIEHSYLGDLEMMLVSPNGTQVNVFNSYTGSGLFAGGFGGGATFLGGANDASSAIGICEEYCFSEQPGALPAWVNGYNTVTTSNSGGCVFSPCEMVEPGIYNPEESFSNFIGDSLDGTWKLIARDNLTQDDGWICSWGLYFEEDYLTGTWIPSSGVSDPNSINTEITVNQSGSYIFVADSVNNGCYDTLTINFNIPSYPNGHFNIAGDTLTQPSGSTTYSSALENNTSYYWTVSNGTITSGQGTNNIDVLWQNTSSGTIILEVNDGCTIHSDTMYVNLGYTGLKEQQNNFYYYPNPTHDQLNITASNKVDKIIFFNLLGEPLFTLPYNRIISSESIDLSNLSNGIYTLKVIYSNSQEQNIKVIKN